MHKHLSVEIIAVMQALIRANTMCGQCAVMYTIEYGSKGMEGSWLNDGFRQMLFQTRASRQIRSDTARAEETDHVYNHRILNVPITDTIFFNIIKCA